MSVFRESVAKKTNGRSSSKLNRVLTRPSSLWERTDLRGLAIVTFQYAAEFGLAANTSFGFRDKVYIEHRVVTSHTPVRCLLVIMFQPRAKNMVELPSTEAEKIVQDLMLRFPKMDSINL